MPCLHVGGQHPTWTASWDSISMVAETPDEQGLGRPVEGCPLATVEPVAHMPPNEPTFTTPQMPSPDPQLTSDLYRVAFGGMAGEPIPGVGAPNTADEAVPSPNRPPALSFGSAPCATQSSGGGGVTGRIPRGQHGCMGTRSTTQYFPSTHYIDYTHYATDQPRSQEKRGPKEEVMYVLAGWGLGCDQKGRQPWCRIMQLQHHLCLATAHLAWRHGRVITVDDAPV